ncbi:MAG: hypothetical protein A2Z88_02850 [Omnitrophica WOR_2 bacterium GWA2_47_8]|nr:MAG: hypothetical protein A2Z88_02850 [Omnitrophica WOR_2 bacterium GWA2_47_8]
MKMKKMKRTILTVTLNPAIDKTITAQQTKKRDGFVGQWRISAGGKGINVSRVLKDLKCKTCAAGFAGGATGAQLKELLRKENIPFDLTHIREETRVNLTIINTATQKANRSISPGPRAGKNELAHFKTKFKKLLKGCGWVVFSGRNILGAPDPMYQGLIKTAQAQHVKTALDSHSAPFSLGLQAKPFLVKPNREEAEAFLKIKLNSKEKWREALRLLLKKGARFALISLGDKGAVGSDGKDLYWAHPPKVKAVNHVGCGDAFLAGFIYAFEKDRGFKDALVWAVACGTAYTLQLPGLKQRVSRARIEKIKDKVKVTRF